MSQTDSITFVPTIIWFILLYFLLYFIIFTFFLFNIYIIYNSSSDLKTFYTEFLSVLDSFFISTIFILYTVSDYDIFYSHITNVYMDIYCYLTIEASWAVNFFGGLSTNSVNYNYLSSQYVFSVSTIRCFSSYIIGFLFSFFVN